MTEWIPAPVEATYGRAIEVSELAYNSALDRDELLTVVERMLRHNFKKEQETIPSLLDMEPRFTISEPYFNSAGGEVRAFSWFVNHDEDR